MKSIHLQLSSLFILAFLLIGSNLAAQEATANRGIIINSSNFEKFKSLVIPELHSLVKAGILQMDVVKDLGYSTKEISQIPYDSSPTNSTEDNLLSVLSSPTARKSNFSILFNSKEVGSNPQSYQSDEVLWNTYSPVVSQQHFKAIFSSNVLTSESSSPKFPIKGSVERILSFSNTSEKALPQLFREKITVLSPQELSPYSWLTFRFISKDPEFIWNYSPAIEKVRQMSSSNRSDPISFGLPEVDDMFVWSGNPNAVEPRIVSIVRAAVPFPSYTQGRLFDLPSGCLGIEDYGMSQIDGPKWNFQTQSFPSGAAWLPSKAVFVPRDLIKVQLHSLDPYYRDSIQTLYIDKELMTPIYKISYNSVGRRRKIVLGGFGLATSADKSKTMLYPSFNVSINYETREAHVIDFTQISNCSSKNLKERLAEFEPKSLLPEKPEEEVEGQA